MIPANYSFSVIQLAEHITGAVNIFIWVYQSTGPCVCHISLFVCVCHIKSEYLEKTTSSFRLQQMDALFHKTNHKFHRVPRLDMSTFIMSWSKNNTSRCATITYSVNEKIQQKEQQEGGWGGGGSVGQTKAWWVRQNFKKGRWQ